MKTVAKASKNYKLKKRIPDQIKLVELSFTVAGTVKQSIELIPPYNQDTGDPIPNMKPWTGEQLAKALRMGQAVTTIQENGQVVFHTKRRSIVVGKVLDVDNECEYDDYEMEMDDTEDLLDDVRRCAEAYQQSNEFHDGVRLANALNELDQHSLTAQQTKELKDIEKKNKWAFNQL